MRVPHTLRPWLPLLLAPLLAGCGAAAPSPAAKPATIALSSSLYANFPALARSSSQVLALTATGAKDQVLVVAGTTGGASVRIVSPAGKTLLARTQVQALAIAQFGTRHLPVLLFETTTNGPWGFPISSFTYVPSLHRFEPVPFNHRSQGLLVMTELQGFATLDAQGVRVSTPTGSGSSASPTGSLTSRWAYQPNAGPIGQWMETK